MNKRRLLKLAELLEADARRKNGVRFDQFDFGTVDDVGRTAPMSCATTACAFGLAAVSGIFKKSAGLTFALTYNNDTKKHDIQFLIDGELTGPFRAAEMVFDLTGEAAEYLFGARGDFPNHGEGAAAERYAAKRIREFVKTNGESAR